MPLLRRLYRAVMVIGHGKPMDHNPDGGKLVMAGLLLSLGGAGYLAWLSWCTPWWPVNLFLLSWPAFLIGYFLSCVAQVYACKGFCRGLLIHLERPVRLESVRRASDEALWLLADGPREFGLWHNHLVKLASEEGEPSFDYYGLDQERAAVCLELHEQGLLVDRYGSGRLIERRGATQAAHAELARREQALERTAELGPRVRLSPLGH